MPKAESPLFYGSVPADIVSTVWPSVMRGRSADILLLNSDGNFERKSQRPAATAAAHVNEPSARAATLALRLPLSDTMRIT